MKRLAIAALALAALRTDAFAQTRCEWRFGIVPQTGEYKFAYFCGATATLVPQCGYRWGFDQQTGEYKYDFFCP